MPNKGLIEEKWRKKNPFIRIPASFHSISSVSFFSPLNFTPIQATPLSLLLLPFWQSFSAFYYRLALHCLCLTKTQRGVWYSCPICQHTKKEKKRKHPPSHHTVTFISPNYSPCTYSLHTQTETKGYGKSEESMSFLHCSCVCQTSMAAWVRVFSLPDAAGLGGGGHSHWNEGLCLRTQT